MVVNRIGKELRNLDELSFEHLLPIKIGRKKILVLWDGQMKEHEAYRILEELHIRWLEQNGDNPDCDACIAWMLAGLKETGLQYITLYIE